MKSSQIPLVVTVMIVQILANQFCQKLFATCVINLVLSMTIYFPLSNIRPWSLIFWEVKSPCGQPYLNLVSYFWGDQRPISSLIITWSLINFSGMKKLFYLRIIFTQGKHETTIFGIFQWTWDWWEILSRTHYTYFNVVLNRFFGYFPIWSGTLTWSLFAFCRNFPIWSVILTWSLIYFWAKSPSSLLF